MISTSTSTFIFVMPSRDQMDNGYVAPYSQLKEEGDRRIAASFENVRNHLKGEEACQRCNKIYSKIDEASEKALEQITIITAIERERKMIHDTFKLKTTGEETSSAGGFFFPFSEITEEERAYNCELQARRNSLIRATNYLHDKVYNQYQEICLNVIYSHPLL